MEINRLTKEQIEQIYTEHLIHDFVANERKPLSAVLKSFEMDAYECLRFSDKETLIGYAFFVKNAHDYMLDYFAIVRGMRDKGFGSVFLQEIAKYCKKESSLICEVENPVYTKAEEERLIQEKRKQFYIRNGFVDTGVDVRTFGVEYRLLEMPLIKAHSEDEIKSLYEKHYKNYLPKAMYKLMIKIR